MVGGMVTAHHNLVGLARVSTVLQDAQLQRDALTAAGFWNSTFRQGSTGQSWGKQVARTADKIMHTIVVPASEPPQPP